MKFKFIFIILSIFILLFLASFVLIPYYVLGSSVSVSFWRMNWPLFLVVIVLFSAFSIFYFTNSKLFFLLEKEDWPALVRYLEVQVIQKGKYSSRLVRLLANSYLVLSDSGAVRSLENKVALSKPALLNENALVFGTARILGQDISGAVRFFELRMETVKASFKDWVRWYHGFALLLDRQFEKAAGEFEILARLSDDGIISALSSYFLADNIAYALPEKEGEFREISSLGRERVLKAMPKVETWKREVSKFSTEIHVAAIARYIEKACGWLYYS